MHKVVIDFETFYDREYTLTELTTIEYVLDPRFEVIGFSYSIDGRKPRWVTGTMEYIRRVLQAIPWDKCMCVAHNAIFDGAILEWVFGCRPARYFCTMMGSRPYVAPYTGKMSLAVVANYFGLGAKGNAIHSAVAKHRLDFTPAQLNHYALYCIGDAQLTMGAMNHILYKLPQDEQDMVDLTIKKFTRPQFLLDEQVIKDRLDAVMTTKARALLTLPKGVTKADLMSNQRLAQKLTELGCTPPSKLNAKGQPAWAFAKTDEGLEELRHHPDWRVRAIVEARLLFKSTQEETRLIRLRAVRALTEWMPIALLFYGAHTGRLSGMDKLNQQNLPRPVKGQQGLRHTLAAPPGHKVVTVDLSQIEARMVAWLAGQLDLVQAFAMGRDIYSEFASDCYGYTVTKASHPTERFVGKTCILGLGYGMGADKLYWTLLAQAAKYGIQITVTLDDCKRWVKIYRSKYSRIPALWRTMNGLLKYMCSHSVAPFSWKMLTLTKDKCRLPNGMQLIYPNIWDAGEEIQYGGPTAIPSYIWGGGFLENVASALAQIIIKRAELRLAKHGLIAALQVHDELVFVVRDEMVDRVKRALQRVILDPVPWAPGLPLACEIGEGQSYGDAK